MTHNDIKEKFLIEYDKANVTSSYPSLTSYEIATILDKAYLALIAQKVTGNNPRRAPFEADTKAISDVQELITFERLPRLNIPNPPADNATVYDLPTTSDGNGDQFLYYVSGMVYLSEQLNPVVLVSHETAQKFKQSSTNRPWIKNPVAYIESGAIVMLYDNYASGEDGMSNMNHKVQIPGEFHITFIKEPAKFVNDLDESTTPFELNDSMAEELISLAVTFALENVESTRLQTAAQMRGLEA